MWIRHERKAFDGARTTTKSCRDDKSDLTLIAYRKERPRYGYGNVSGAGPGLSVFTSEGGILAYSGRAAAQHVLPNAEVGMLKARFAADAVSAVRPVKGSVVRLFNYASQNAATRVNRSSRSG